MINTTFRWLFLCGSLLSSRCVIAEEIQSLPDPLVSINGDPVSTPELWRASRRQEILEQFRTHVYGRAPLGRPLNLRFETVKVDADAVSGKATLKQVDIHFGGRGGKGVLHLALFVPNNTPKPVPGFVLIGNRSQQDIDPTRQHKSPFWPAEQIVERGYFAAAFLNSDLDPDEHDGFKNGAHGIFDPQEGTRSPDAWGSIAAWAWGASRVMDYLETDSDVDATRTAVVGHSRGGKTSLWCGAEDERFAMVVSNDSGCTGAALACRKKGERIADINRNFPHWFCQNYKNYNDREDDLPIDQHQLIALMAPRLVYVTSATEDAWADPEGEFLSCLHAAPVYDLFGLAGVGVDKIPPPDQPLHSGAIAYHLRTGKHDLTAFDWNGFMDFADQKWLPGENRPD